MTEARPALDGIARAGHAQALASGSTSAIRSQIRSIAGLCSPKTDSVLSRASRIAAEVRPGLDRRTEVTREAREPLDLARIGLVARTLTPAMVRKRQCALRVVVGRARREPRGRLHHRAKLPVVRAERERGGSIRTSASSSSARRPATIDAAAHRKEGHEPVPGSTARRDPPRRPPSPGTRPAGSPRSRDATGSTSVQRSASGSCLSQRAPGPTPPCTSPRRSPWPPRVRASSDDTCASSRSSVSRVTHAIVLIKAAHDSLSGLGDVLADVDGVAEAYSVTGEWDFVAMVRVDRARGAGRRGGRRPGRAARRGAGRTRWWPSRSSRSTTSSRCSRSGSSAEERAHRAPEPHGNQLVRLVLRSPGARPNPRTRNPKTGHALSHGTEAKGVEVTVRLEPN